MAESFKPGEIVDITIKAACIDAVVNNGIQFVMPNGTTVHIDLSSHEGVTIDLVAPAEWPPRVGDLWRDQYGDLWFANEGHDEDGGTYVDLHCSISKVTEAWGSQIAHSVNGEYGPLTLVHREEVGR